MTFAEINKARAKKNPNLAQEYIVAVRDRRVLTTERNDLVLLLLACHQDGTSKSDAHGRPESVFLMRGYERVSIRIRWGSDGVPRLGPKSREQLLAWFSKVPVPRTATP